MLRSPASCWRTGGRALPRSRRLGGPLLIGFSRRFSSRPTGRSFWAAADAGISGSLTPRTRIRGSRTRSDIQPALPGGLGSAHASGDLVSDDGRSAARPAVGPDRRSSGGRKCRPRFRNGLDARRNSSFATWASVRPPRTFPGSGQPSLYPIPGFVCPADRLARNRLGQSALWQYGISGDLPMFTAPWPNLAVRR